MLILANKFVSYFARKKIVSIYLCPSNETTKWSYSPPTKQRHGTIKIQNGIIAKDQKGRGVNGSIKFSRRVDDDVG